MKLSRLYLADETAWLEQMSQLIRERRFDKIDAQNLSEYLQDMAKRDRREVASHLTVLLVHLLKWECQPRKRSRSWQVTLLAQRQDMQDILDSKTLRNHALEILARCYAKAVKRAAAETGLAESKFPSECPWTLDEILSDE